MKIHNQTSKPIQIILQPNEMITNTKFTLEIDKNFKEYNIHPHVHRTYIIKSRL